MAESLLMSGENSRGRTSGTPAPDAINHPEDLSEGLSSQYTKPASRGRNNIHKTH